MAFIFILKSETNQCMFIVENLGLGGGKRGIKKKAIFPCNCYSHVMVRLVSLERNRPQYVHQHGWIAKIVTLHQRGQTRSRIYLLTLFMWSSRRGKTGASLVAQWLRICLPMQGTRVRALVWGDPTCRGATRPVSHDY